jgi:protein-disulfide isomerase
LRIAAALRAITLHPMRRYLPFLIIAGVLLVALGAGWFLFRYRGQSPVPPKFANGRAGAAPAHIRGEANAPAQLEEFGDFECLPCSKLFPILETLERDYGRRFAVLFREHPLKKHRYGMDAARAAEAAGLQGRFWEMHDILYRNRATWVPAQYIGPYLNEYAAAIGLDVDRFKADMDGDEVSKRIAADQDRGDSLGIDRTPVIFLNGEQLPVTAHNEKALREAIDKALGSSGR